MQVLHLASCSDRLAKRGLPHLAVCPHCDQAEETVQHILVACVFSRQVWAVILHKLGLGSLAPQPSVNRFAKRHKERSEQYDHFGCLGDLET